MIDSQNDQVVARRNGAARRIDFPAVATHALLSVGVTPEHKTKMKITTGRTVLYVLNEADVDAINRRRTDGGSIKARIESEKWPLGAQAHIGNTVQVGDICPAVAIRVWGDGDNPPVNFQVLLDGNDTYWATSRHEDESKSPGMWHWPARG